MLSTKKRILLILLPAIAILIGGSPTVIARIGNLVTNTHDPLFFDRPMNVKYRYDNGSLAAGTLSFEVTNVGTTTSTVKATENGVSTTFTVTHDGFFVDGATTTSNQTFFWIHIVDTGTFGSEFIPQIGKTHQIIDPTGIFGLVNQELNLTTTGFVNYWPTEPAIDGAQASISFIIKNVNNHTVAEGIMDRTTGLVFKLQFTAGIFRTIEIISTNYDISRNRYSSVFSVLIAAIALPILAYIIFWKTKKFKIEDKDERVEISVLLGVGTAAIFIDIWIDVWFYARLGSYWGNFILHASCTGVFLGICIWKKYGLKATIPAILELGFVTGMSFADSSYVPYLTAFMGLMISWILMVILSGYKPHESRSLKEKIAKSII
jgi:hypothetical protein